LIEPGVGICSWWKEGVEGQGLTGISYRGGEDLHGRHGWLTIRPGPIWGPLVPIRPFLRFALFRTVAQCASRIPRMLSRKLVGLSEQLEHPEKRPTDETGHQESLSAGAAQYLPCTATASIPIFAY